MKLMAEMLDHAPESWTPSERLIVVSIAEQANDTTRRGYPGIELIAHRAGVDVGTVSKSLNRLRKKGVELRVAMKGSAENGRAVYAARGHRTIYLIPKLCPLPAHSTTECVRRVAGGPVLGSEMPEERADQGPAFAEERSDGGPTIDGERADGGPERADGGPPLPLSPLKEPSPQTSGPTDGKAVRRDWNKLDDNDRRHETLPEPLRTIAASLAQTDPDATVDEARAVLRWIADQATATGKPIKGIRYYQAIASSGGFQLQLANVRAQRSTTDTKAREAAQEAVRDELARLREAEPECKHGTAAGNSPHPSTGELLCPQCRRGIPAPREAERAADPAAPVIDAYQSGWRDAGHEPIEMSTLVAVRAEVGQLLAVGNSPELLAEFATHAGAARNTLTYVIRKLQEARQ